MTLPVSEGEAGRSLGQPEAAWGRALALREACTEGLHRGLARGGAGQPIEREESQAASLREGEALEEAAAKQS